MKVLASSGGRGGTGRGQRGCCQAGGFETIVASCAAVVVLQLDCDREAAWRWSHGGDRMPERGLAGQLDALRRSPSRALGAVAVLQHLAASRLVPAAPPRAQHHPPKQPTCPNLSLAEHSGARRCSWVQQRKPSARRRAGRQRNGPATARQPPPTTQALGPHAQTSRPAVDSAQGHHSSS